MLLIKVVAIMMILPIPFYIITDLTMTGQYSTVQKLSLAGMVVGGLMCLVGAGSPYWLVSDPQDESGLSQLVSKVVKYYIGLFMTCIEVLGQEKCKFSEVDNDSGECNSSF